MPNSPVRNQSIVPATVLALALSTLPGMAYAHAGMGETGGFLHGMAHPAGGLDHLCTMIAVGLWAAQLGGRAILLVPLTFVAIMASGGLLGMEAIQLPFAETGIVMSLLVLGILIAATVRLPLPVSAMIVGMFAVFHGYAHGAEMPPDSSGLLYALGFLLATALLHASGAGTALAFKTMERAQMLRYAGAGITLYGSYLGLAG